MRFPIFKSFTCCSVTRSLCDPMACQASLSLIISWNLPKFISIESLFSGPPTQVPDLRLKPSPNGPRDLASGTPWPVSHPLPWSSLHEAETKKQSIVLFSLSWECGCNVTQIFIIMCACE